MMGDKLKRQKELIARHPVQGRFYELVVNGKVHCFRRVLEIGSPSHDSLADAVVVMMNPGGSIPCDPHESSTDKMVPTHPDETQFRIMELMERVRWRYVRVLNLSDLRNPDSGRFMEEIQRFKDNKEHEHSMFSSDRNEELLSFLRRAPDAPIIAAWGCNNSLEPLARQALSSLKNERLVGRTGGSKRQLQLANKSPELQWRYWHPLLRSTPKQNEWLESMVRQIKHS
jgi:hypothetical protein